MKFVVLSLLVLSASASALPFRDSFESQNLSSWSKSNQSVPQNTLTVVPAAAHAGGFGLRLVDADDSTGAQGQNHLGVPAASGTSNLYGRFWMNAVQTSGAGEMRLFRIQNTTNAVMTAFGINVPALQLSLSYGSASTGFQNTNAVVLTAGWHLIEFALTDIGTASGRSALWVDGTSAAQSAVLDWTPAAWRTTGFDLGEPFSFGAATGTVDFDDVALAVTPLPSRILPVSVQAGPIAGSCLALLLQVRASTDPAPVPLDVIAPVALSSAGARLEFYSDPACQKQTVAALFAVGETQKTVYVRAPFAGTATVIISSPDLLPGTATLEFRGLIARASASPSTVDAPGQVQLSGKSSTPASGAAITGYQWRQVGGAEHVELTAVSEQTVTLKEPGRYIFELTVSDSNAHISAPATAEVLVQGPLGEPHGKLGCYSAPGACLSLAMLVLLNRRRR